MTRLTRTLLHPTLTSLQFSVAIALALTAFYNIPLWRTIAGSVPSVNVTSGLFLLSFVVFIIAALTIIMTLLGARYVQKPIAIFILMSAAAIAYFMNSYGVLIDKEMIQNTFETDPAEARDLLSGKLFLYIFFLGVLPSLLILRTRVTYRPFWHEIKAKILVILTCSVVIGLIDIAFYKEYSSTFRNNRQIRHLIVPTNYLYYSGRYLSGAYEEQTMALEPVGRDATMDAALWKEQPKPVITVVVVGETARAMNFSLNGYNRNTNPLLSQQSIQNYTDMSSCGTSTAVSVPCMFSDLTHETYDASRVRSRENVLDIISHAGINVLWRDNNSGCKGVCERIKTEDAIELKAEKFCSPDECYDEVMLNNLDDYLGSITGNAVIVLHQKGSHGPAYSMRYPEKFEQFKPVCTSSDLQTCSREEITNAYDNTILYTDYFLNQVIEFLKEREDRFASSMIYLSDHGESLGENNLYLHGLPYFMAPKEQTHVPFISWFSPEYLGQMKLNEPCISGKTKDALSQDNLFHSLLGLLAINTQVYKPELDIFGTCRGGQ